MSTGEELYKNCDSRKNVYFCIHMYKIPTLARLGSIVELPLPSYSSQECIVPNMCTLESYRLKLRANIRNSLKTTLGSRRVHLKWKMPIDVFVDLFSTNTLVSRMKVSFVSRMIQMEWLNNFLSPGWDHKVVSTGFDVVKCVMDPGHV